MSSLYAAFITGYTQTQNTWAIKTKFMLALDFSLCVLVAICEHKSLSDWASVGKCCFYDAIYFACVDMQYVR